MTGGSAERQIPENIDRELAFLHRKVAFLEKSMDKLIEFMTENIPNADFKLMNLQMDRDLESQKRPSSAYRDRS